MKKSLLRLGFQRCEMLHQTALAARSIVAMYHAPAGGLVPVLNGEARGFLRSLHITAGDSCASLLHKGARARAVHFVVLAALFVLALALQRGFVISQVEYLQTVQALERVIVSRVDGFV